MYLNSEPNKVYIQVKANNNKIHLPTPSEIGSDQELKHASSFYWRPTGSKMEAKIGVWGGCEEDTSKGLIILIQPLPFLDAIFESFTPCYSFKLNYSQNIVISLLYIKLNHI